MNLPSEWADIRNAAISEIDAGRSVSYAIYTAVERCYALANKPVRELTAEEIYRAFDPADEHSSPEFHNQDWLARIRNILMAHQRKQQEPETVTVQVRFWRYTDSAKGRCEPRSFTSDEDDLTVEFPGGYTNAEWLGAAQTIEVKV